MGGLAKICKRHGSLEAIDSNGEKIIWIWDYVNDKPRLKLEMTKKEIKESQKAKAEIEALKNKH